MIGEAMLGLFLLGAGGVGEVKKECDPPSWLVNVYFESPVEAGKGMNALFGFCSQETAMAFRDDVDQHGLRQYGVSYQWNSVSHSNIRGFYAGPNVWGVGWREVTR